MEIAIPHMSEDRLTPSGALLFRAVYDLHAASGADERTDREAALTAYLGELGRFYGVPVETYRAAADAAWAELVDHLGGELPEPWDRAGMVGARMEYGRIVRPLLGWSIL